ncbi:MAG TPA: bifunctional UDP-N-acetylglucosamine diphosphorylase/glucosamine-1-phosphate N-acetyltransferase GlmU [Methyloceanibacter sp.]|jgi:bifunctional UDP-N-acetylglucosamine pyrophosphorylase/glucosamine-1-phosphate N-acetyltransferase|nr:bifunctional UDP-N-acetylglucosamine diphosphorylase/glucosamine-1-phosphate N-acetyltransferase GlmU [Methyloceanibacter sp.]
MTETPALAIILAAGKGTRMKSALPKVLHRLAGAPLLAHVLSSVKAAGLTRGAIVIGPGMEEVAEAANALNPKLAIFVQAEQLGTADAVKAARRAIEEFDGQVLVLYGDTPLLTSDTLNKVRAELKSGADLVVIGFETENPTGYGRLLLDDRGGLAAIREEKDASPAERALMLCNSGIMAFRSAKTLLGLLGRIGNDNAKKEYYLTEAVALARGDRLEARMVKSNAEEVLGVNSRAELAEAEAAVQKRLRAQAMENGATLIAPDTVFLSHDTKIGKDVVIEPHVVIGERVVIEDGAIIKSFCYMQDARIGSGAILGPFARLRPGAALARDSRVGNFVEIKQSEIGEGAKVNHLTYIGDTCVGPRANVGAGTITCNYDGFAKHRTEIGAGAFIGSNSSLVAPVKIGEGAYIGSGSVISKDVSPDALALSRSPQEEREGWAAKMRERRKHQPKPSGNKGT